MLEWMVDGCLSGWWVGGCLSGWWVMFEWMMDG